MSSMRNAVQRRNHRERAQPAEREKWGLLEKHKDYSARAKDYNEKKKKLRALRHKVLEKNPDEFYFGMLSKKGPSASGKKRTGTLNGDRGFEALSQEAVRLYKTQDLGYIRTVRNKTAKEVETLRKQLLGIHGCEGGKVVFVDDEESQLERLQEDNEEDSDDDAGNDDISKDAVEKRRLRKLQQKEAQKVENRLKIAEQRLKALSDAEEALDLQRAKMAKSPTVGGFNKDGVKFRVRERKR